MKQMQSSYVSAVAPGNVQTEQRPKPTHEGISAQVSGNMAGGIGAFAIVVALWLIVWGILHAVGIVAEAWPNPAQVLVSAAIAGLLTFGALMFVRNSLDEALDTATRINLEQYISELESGIVARDKRISDLKVELNIAQAQASVASLRTASRDTYVPPVVKLGPEWDDARTLIERRWSGQSWARDIMRKELGDKRWSAAMQCLHRAGVATRKNSDSPWEPWDKSARIDEALYYLDKQREHTLSILESSLAQHGGDASTHSDANSEAQWGRGGE